MFYLNRIRITKIGLPLQLILIFIVVLLFDDYLTQEVKSGFYALSLSIRAVLQFVLPFVIFSCLFSCIMKQRKKAIGFIFTLFLAVSFSNLVSTLAGYFAGRLGLSYIPVALQESLQETNILRPLWNLEFNNPISNGVALCSAIIVGVVFSLYPHEKADNFAQKINEATSFFLSKIFTPILPLFALGFILKMQHEGMLSKLVDAYLPVMCLIFFATFLYLIIIFVALANFNFKNGLIYFKNSLPASMIGFSTLSSLAAVPMTIESTKKNIGNDEIAKIVIPATVNNHMIGSSIMIPIIAMYILLAYGLALPSFKEYLIFAQFFVLAKFMVAAVPGGSIIVMLPLLENHLHFTSDMSSMVTTIYLLFNPFVSSANVFGNNAFAIFLSKIFKEK